MQASGGLGLDSQGLGSGVWNATLRSPGTWELALWMLFSFKFVHFTLLCTTTVVCVKHTAVYPQAPGAGGGFSMF